MGVVTVFDADVCGLRFLRIVEGSDKIFVVFDEISGIMEPIVVLTIVWGTAEFGPFGVLLVTAAIKPVDSLLFEEFVGIDGFFEVEKVEEEEIVVNFDWVNGLLETVEFCWVITFARLGVINFDEEFNVFKPELFDRFNLSGKVDGELAKPFEKLVFIPFEDVAELVLLLIVNNFLSTVALVVNPVAIVEIVCDLAKQILSKIK